MNSSFESLQLGKPLIHNLQNAGILTPTAVQQEAIPALLAGRDVIAQSQTGSGKTLAYALPVLERTDPALKKLQAVILVPTRELGAQIFRVLEQASQGMDVSSQLLIGGAAIKRQIDRLRLHPQIVIGTPGRVLELIKLRKLSMHQVQTIVIDEADHIWEQGEGREVEAVIQSALRDRQLCFFSATIPGAVLGLADKWMREPVRIHIEPERKTAESIEHTYVVCSQRERIDTLRRLVRTLEPSSGIVFTNQVDEFGEILAKLKYAGLSIEGLYSEAGKQERAKVMRDFREGSLQLLLATDVAARGLDMPGVTHVFHFDLPVDADHYVHRSGRTGRMGRHGMAIALCAPDQLFIIEKFSKALGIAFERKVLFEGRLVGQEELPKRLVQRKAVDGAPREQAGGRTPGETGEGGRRAEAAGAGERPGKPPVRGRDGAVGSGAESQSRSISGGQKRPPHSAKSARKADQKNKGAPRWLKEKRSP